MKKLWLIFAVILVVVSVGVLYFLRQSRLPELVRSSFCISGTEEVYAPLDFEKLQELNPDIHAWMYIPGTNIDVPIVQHADDNTYYLNHSVYGEEDINGAVFTENHNSTDFSDYITGIYGSSFDESSGFHDLYKYVDRVFLEEHNQLILYLPGKVLTYRIFAAYVGENNNVVVGYDRGIDPKAREHYLDDILRQRSMNDIIDRHTDVNYDSKILTLSTNYKSENNFRFLMQAYLEEISE